MYQFTKKSEYLFFKILNYDSLLNLTSNNLFRDYLNQSSYSLLRNTNGNLLVKNINYNLTNLYITYIRSNIWEIKYISNSGFLFINKNLNLKRKYLLYKKIFIYNKKGNIIPGVLIPNKRKNLRNLRNLKIKIDIGTQDFKEVYSLGINLGDKVGLQEDFSIFNKKYLLSNEITNKIGLFILWEILNYNFKTNLNFLLIKYNITKLYLMNYLVKLSFLINNTLKILEVFITKILGREVISFCQRNNINIKILTKNKLTYYILNVKIKYFQSPIEMILKSEIEKIINLIIFVVRLNIKKKC
ncbi:hypothetical protein ACWNYD_00235 [Candidatus Karelsulcia muelleri]